MEPALSPVHALCAGIGAVLLAGLVAACGSEPQPVSAYPDEPPIPLSAPVGGSRLDFDVARFDTCAPFSSSYWVTTAIPDAGGEPQAVPEPGGGCRWRGPGLTATITVDSGRSLAEYSNDPRFRPGGTGMVGNRFWRTAASDATRTCDFFLAAGPARPDQVVHLSVATEAGTAPMAGGGRMHACMFAMTLTRATSLILEGPLDSPSPTPR
jgi:hypothetical protein